MGKPRQYGVWSDKTSVQEEMLKGYRVYRYAPKNNFPKTAFLLDAGWWREDTGNFNVNLNLEIPTEGEVVLGRSRRNVSKELRAYFGVRRNITALEAKKARGKDAQLVNVQFYTIIPECPCEQKMSELPKIIENALVIEE